jgi:hypothetical protein
MQLPVRFQMKNPTFANNSTLKTPGTEPPCPQSAHFNQRDQFSIPPAEF